MKRKRSDNDESTRLEATGTIEREIQVDIQLSKVHYNFMLEEYSKKCKPTPTTIFYFSNDVRVIVAPDIFIKQCKEIVSRRNIMKIINSEPEYFLVTRTTSKETFLKSVPPMDYTLGTCLRYIIWYAEVTDDPDVKNIRISLDNVARLSNGVMIEQFRLRFELEYKESATDFNRIDNQLYQILIKFKHLYFPIVSPINWSLLMNCPSRPFFCFHETQLNDKCLYLPKYDGFRAKLGVNRNGQVSYVDDTNRLAIGVAPCLRRFENFIFQLEILATESKAVITDVLGVYVHQTLYSAALEDVFALFQQIDDKVDKPTYLEFTTDNREYKFELIFQQPIPPDTIPSQFTELPTDGTIIVNNDKLFKLKALTFDARYKKNCFYLDDQMLAIHRDDCGEYVENGIYELCFISSGIRVVRFREDRRTTDSSKKYHDIMEEYKHLAELHRN